MKKTLQNLVLLLAALMVPTAGSATYAELGDVNSDGYINISDVTCLIDFLLKGDTVSIDAQNADMDDSSDVNITDVTLLIDYMLKKVASGIDLGAADCDMDGEITISDVTTLIDFLITNSW